MAALVLTWMILLGLFSIVLFLFALFGLIGCFSLAPYVATTKRIAAKMVELSEVKEGMKVVEIGSGNGTISIEAARHGASVTGIEINPVLVWWSTLRAWESEVSQRTHFLRGSVWSWKIPHDTDVVMIYGMPNAMTKIWKKMEKECRPGTLLVSHAFTVKEKTPVKREGTVLVYRT